MPFQGRADKTIDKMRRGGLPAPTKHTGLVGRGDRRPCDGCSETIHPSETQWVVTLQQTFQWRFHEECYDAWVSFHH